MIGGLVGATCVAAGADAVKFASRSSPRQWFRSPTAPSIARQVALAWLLTLPAAAAFGADAAWVAATGPVGTIIVVVVLIGLADGILGSTR